ncbi:MULTISPECIES: hypothetical protein [Streptomyces]|uniref:hypothetical protein n=1 Tax=Streptomyces TaxID=1883 RepID=UPI002556598C|nr:hypothetical protein [Streptomyces sp. NBRC 13847]
MSERSSQEVQAFKSEKTVWASAWSGWASRASIQAWASSSRCPVGSTIAGAVLRSVPQVEVSLPVRRQLPGALRCVRRGIARRGAVWQRGQTSCSSTW